MLYPTIVALVVGIIAAGIYHRRRGASWYCWLIIPLLAFAIFALVLGAILAVAGGLGSRPDVALVAGPALAAVLAVLAAFRAKWN